MPLTSEVQSAVSLLENLQGSLRGCDEPRLGVQYTNDLNTLISVLHNPVLNKIIAIQDSLQDLKKELARHPSLLPSDFDISPRRGELTLHFPSGGVEEEGGEIYPKRKSSKASAQPLQSSSREILDSDKSLQNSYDAHPLAEHESSAPQRQWMKNGRESDADSEDELVNNEAPEEDHDGSTDIPQTITNATLDAELHQLIRVAAEGRQIHHIQMYKPEGTSLGFSVVGLKSENRGSLGIYVQEIQSTGIAAKDGRLREGDQILAIDGQVLDSYMSHHQAIGILQKANKLVDLVIARAPIIDPIESEPEQPDSFQRQKSIEQHPLASIIIKDPDQLFVPQQQFTTTHIVPPSVESRTSNMLNTEWAQVEVIHLVNDGSGLGFGIIGGRSTGVVVKTILPGGVADREGRLQSGDHILQIGEVNLRGMGSDQVASVLRQAGSHVRLVVARPVESASPDFQIGKEAPIIETRVLNDPEELDRHLTLISNGFPTSSTIALASLPGGNGGGLASSSTSSASTVPAGIPTNGHSDYINGDSELLAVNNQIASTSAAVAVVASEGHLTSAGGGGGGGGFLSMESIGPCDEGTVAEGGEGMLLADLPEMENINLDLAKDHQGLGITIAGYVCEREELSGIFVKSINAGSAADRSGQIQVNDQIVEVDGKSLTGLSNHAAVEVLRSTGQRVRLRLARYLRGPKFEQLQQAIANSELKTHPSTPNPPRAPHCGEVPSSEAIRTALGELEAENTSRSRESLVEAYNPSLAPSIPSHPPPAAQNTSVSTNKESYEQTLAKGISTVDVVQGTTSKPASDVRLEDIELLIDTDYTGELRPSVENAIVRKWSRIVGPDFDIVVAQLKKFERGGGLGISLEGTVDVEDGREVRPHHYIRSILPDGPVGRDGRLKSGDELLEVNNQKLLGLNHVEVVTILKDLPQAVRIVCGRRISGSTTPIHSGDVAQRESFGDRNVLGGSLQSLIPSSERLVKAKSDGSLASSTTNANSDSNSFTKVKSRSLEPLTGLAMWSTEPQHIELIKGERGLGFSILDYQDPMNPQETVIVIRSLVPGGVAEKDGRLIPGDRLVGVNGTSLEKASLDEAVAELKGAPKGPVIISVAKPISVLESPGQLDMILGDLGSSEGGSDVTEDVADWKCDGEDDRYQLEERRKRRKTNDSIISTSSVPPDLPYSDPPMLDRDESVMMVPVATERLIGGSSSSSAANSAAPSSGEEDMSPHPSPVPQPRIHSLGLALPKQLERVVRIQKGGDQLGINIQVVDNGVNGVVVSSVARGGAVHKDGRIQAGDLIVSVNSESMRNISSSQARAILRRTHLVTSDISIVFIPGEDAAKHRESRLQSFKPDIVQTVQEHRYPYGSREGSEDERLGVSSDLTRSSTAPSFVTRQLRSRDTSQEEPTETHPAELQVSSAEVRFVEARPSSSLSDVSGAAATVVTLKNAISEVLGTEERSRLSQKSGGEENEEGPFTITFRNVTEAGLVRGDLQSHTDESLRAPSGLGGGIADSELRTAQFEPVQLTDVLYNQFLSSTNTSSCPSTIYTSSTLPNITASEAPPSVRFVRFSDNKVGTELSGSSDSSLIVECGDSDKHSGSDIYFLDENYSENYSGAKLVVAHITDVESLVHKRALSSSRSFEEYLLSKDPRNARLQKQQSEVIPSVPCYYDPDTLKDAHRPQQAKQDAFRKRLLYSEDPKHITKSVYLDSYEVDQNYSYIPTTTTTTITSSSSLTGVQVAPSNISSSSAIRQENLEMTVSQGMNEAATVEGRNMSGATPPAMDGKHWGPERIVEVKRDENGSLGISIVGGKVDVSWSGSSVTGIFVKNVLTNSPAGKSGLLKTGDRILEVEGVDLRTASHEKAVEVIKKTGNPVTFVVQSLVHWNTASTNVSRETSRLEIHPPDAVPPARTPTPELIQPGLSDQKKQELQEKSREIVAQKKEAAVLVAGGFSSSLDKMDVEDEEEESSDEEDTRGLQGRTTSAKGVEIDRASAGALKCSKAERLTDTEEDQFGYTQKKVQKKYSSPDGEVHLIELQKGSSGLGISLAGHKDRKQMSVYVCGMNPTGNAYKDGRIQVGDEILEVNGYVVEGRSHLNASTIFKGIPGPSIKIIIRRRKTGLQDMAVKPLTHFPVTLEDESPEEKYARFKGLKKFVMKKGQYGLGIMIIEGKHAEYGNGIFISDLQEGSIAAEAGLMVGDMILLVNKEEMIGVDYEMAASILKKTEGVITMWVANAARFTGPTPTTESFNTDSKTAPPTPAKNTEPKKPEIPPKPSVLPKPPIPAKPASIHMSQSAASNHPLTSTTTTTTTSYSNPGSISSSPNPPNLEETITSTSIRSSSLSTALPSSGSLRKSLTSSSATSSEELPVDPSSSEIKPGIETTIEIVREKMGLGLSIVGGTDTLLGAIIIHEVYADGAASKDGRLKPGDQVLEVNNEDFRVITHQKALNALRQTPSKVKLVVYREESSQKEEDLYDIISVQLTKKSGKGLGLSIVGRKNGTGVFISDLVPGGVAESDGRLMQGDQILEVNNKSLRSATQEQAAAILKCAPASVSMKIGRLKPGKKVSPNVNPTWPVTISEGPTRTPSSLSPEFPFPQPPHLISPHTIPQLQPSSTSPQPHVPKVMSPPISMTETPTLRTVVLERGDDGLGFSIVGGFGSNLGDLPIYVKSVFERGAAAREGSLRRGDQILQVNGHSLAGLTHAQAVGILKDAKGTVTLTILPSK